MRLHQEGKELNPTKSPAPSAGIGNRGPRLHLRWLLRLSLCEASLVFCQFENSAFKHWPDSSLVGPARDVQFGPCPNLRNALLGGRIHECTAEMIDLGIGQREPRTMG